MTDNTAKLMATVHDLISFNVPLSEDQLTSAVQKAMKLHSLTIEPDWNTDMDAAPRPALDTLWHEITHFMAYWPKLENGDGSWGEHYSETWYAPKIGRFMCYSIVDSRYAPVEWQPIAWKPITPYEGG